ncbi:MAG: hypothetical protein LBV43_11405 [Prevotella sp.]|jgi:hypothetical protein|nr:hypothetical protein [Prevotella sp.]
MKKILLGSALGLVAAGAVIYKLKKDGKLDDIFHDLHVYSSKKKRDIKNVIDAGKNQVEYVKDRIEYEFNNGKEMLKEKKANS